MRNHIIDSIVDQFGNVIGDVKIDKEGDFYHGVFTPRNISSALKELFEAYEYSVNNQILSRVDNLQVEILNHGLALKSSFEPIKEIQLFGNEITIWI